LDWVLVLPEGLKQAFRSELEQYEQERQMPYVTSIEEMAIEEGRNKERQQIALNLLRQNILLDVIVQATGLSLEQIQALRSTQQDN
jgi:predicted transposase/invertase (TIGR01784 family)